MRSLLERYIVVHVCACDRLLLPGIIMMALMLELESIDNVIFMIVIHIYLIYANVEYFNLLFGIFSKNFGKLKKKL